MTNEKAIETLESIRTAFERDEWMDSDVEALNMAIQALRQEPRWIPVSERLPKVEQRVIFGMNNGAIYIGALHMLGNDLKITLEPTGIGCVYSFENVIAWMPLPQPYKTESEVSDADSN